MPTKVATHKPAPARREETVTRPSPAKPFSVPNPARTSEDARFDRLVYERVRLGIMSALAVNEQLTFNELKALFEVSDGNLSAHARKLEEAATSPARSRSKGGGPSPSTA